MASKPRLIIDRAGEQYAVDEAVYRSRYAGAGFTILRYEDGTEYAGAGAAPNPGTMGDLRNRAKAAGLTVPSRASKATIQGLLDEHESTGTIVESLTSTPTVTGEGSSFEPTE